MTESLSTHLARGGRFRGAGFCAPAVVVTLLLAACGGGGTDSQADAGETPTQVTMVLREAVETFDPMATAGGSGALQMYEAIYDTLVRRDIKSGEIVPAMAETWEVSATEITFHLKPELTCSDGSALAPTDVANSLNRLADPKTGSLYTGRVFGPGGAKAITADDAADTVTVTVNQPNTDMLDALRNAWIVCPAGLKDTKALASQPQGSGPYKIVKSEHGDTFELERWDSPAVENIEDLPERITMKVVTSDSTRANLFETEQADIVNVLGRDATRLTKENEPIEGKSYGADAIMVNQNAGHAGADKQVREAIAQAVDSASYTKAASFDVGSPIDTLTTPNMDCYVAENGKLKLPYDPAKAKASLAAAGYGPGKKELKLDVVGYDVQNSGPDYVADALRQIGIEVAVKQVTQEQVAGIVYGNESPWDIFVFPLATSLATPYSMVQKFSDILGEGPAYNPANIQNATYDSYAAKASGALGDQRCDYWSRAEAAIISNVDMIPLMWSVAAYFGRGLTFQTEHRALDLRTIRATGK